MAQEKKMAQEIIKLNKAILKNVTRFPVPFFPVLLFWSHFLWCHVFRDPFLTPLVLEHIFMLILFIICRFYTTSDNRVGD